MDKTVKRLYEVLIIAGVIILLFILAVANPTSTNNSDFSIYNSGWNGCSQIAIKTYKSGNFQPTITFDQNELTPVQKSFVEYDLDPEKSSIVIIGPTVTFSESEVRYIKNFLEKGGILLLSDDFGSANDLLLRIGAISRFSNDLLLDFAFEKKSSFVSIFNFLNDTHPILWNVSSILLNYPTSIETSINCTVIATSSNLSWLDKNENKIMDENEPMGPFPILVVENFKNGKIVLFSGPSVFINSMKYNLDNEIFRENIFNFVYDGRSSVIIDESHRGFLTPFKIAYVFPSTISNELKISIILLVVAGFVVAFTRIPKEIVTIVMSRFKKPMGRKSDNNPKLMIDNIMDKHPRWNRKKIERIIQRMK